MCVYVCACVRACVRACVCVCVRERERAFVNARESGGQSEIRNAVLQALVYDILLEEGAGKR